MDRTMNRQQFELLEEECDWKWHRICKRIGLNFDKYRDAWVQFNTTHKEDIGDAYDFYKEHMEKDLTKLVKLLQGFDGQKD